MISHLSATQIAMWLRCRESWRRRYICGDIIPPSASAAIGSGVHTAAAAALRERREARRMPTAHVVDLAVETFDQLRSGGLWDADNVDLGMAQRACQRAAETWDEHVCPIVPERPDLAVEERLELDVSGVSVPIVAIADVMYPGEIRELKTSKKAWSKSKPHMELQPTVYAAAHIGRYGTPCGGVVYDVISSGVKPSVQHLTTARDESDLRSLAAVAARMIAAVERGDFGGAPPDVWWCSPSWCGYWSTCQEISARARTFFDLAKKETDGE